MRRLPLLSTHKSSRVCICHFVSAAAVWIAAGTVLVLWPGPSYADHSSITPFSLEQQYHAFSRDDLREIFFGRRTRWPDGSQLRVYVLPDQHPLHIRFSKEVLGVFPYQLRSAWDRMVYSGTGTPPVVVESLEEMQSQIRQIPGAIGYIEQ